VVYKKPLPPQYADLERYGVAGDAARAAGFQIVGEQQWAIDSNFMPCGWKEWDVAWCRVILDLGIIGKRDALLIDYKTGRPRTEPTQLALFAAVGFIHLPQVDTIQTRFVWTQGAKPHTSEYRRENVDGIWSDILPRVARMRQGIEKRAFDPTPNGLCKEYCPVLTCQHNGRRNG
jgi:hypothetical protein